MGGSNHFWKLLELMRIIGWMIFKCCLIMNWIESCLESGLKKNGFVFPTVSKGFRSLKNAVKTLKIIGGNPKNECISPYLYYLAEKSEIGRYATLDVLGDVLDVVYNAKAFFVPLCMPSVVLEIH